MAPTSVDSQVWTWEEYARLPDNGWYDYQVLDGEVFVSPRPSLRHQQVSRRLLLRLHEYVEVHGLGEVVYEINLVMGRGRYVNPDLVFLPTAREHGIQGPNGLWLETPPALIVEITSPSTRAYDRVRKRRAYEEFMVDEYWIVDPEQRSAEVYRFAEAARAGAEPTPELRRGRLLWAPAAGLPPLDIDLATIWV